MNKHKLSGYCIRGGEQIAERIRKVFEADGMPSNCGYKFTFDQAFYYLSLETLAWTCGIFNQNVRETYSDLTEITIEQAEAIVYGSESEKTFPREMLVSDDEKTWYKKEVSGYCEDIEWSWLVYVDGSISSYQGWLFAREIPETIPYNRAKEIISDFIDKGVNDFEIETKKK